MIEITKVGKIPVKKLKLINSRDIFAICSCYESTIEWEDRERCKNKLIEWGVTFDEAVDELKHRGCIK